MVLYLRAANQPIWKEAVKLLGMKEKETPDFSEEWLEELLSGMLYKDPHMDRELPELKGLQKRLSRMGMIERRRFICVLRRHLTKCWSRAFRNYGIGRILDFERSMLGRTCGW